MKFLYKQLLSRILCWSVFILFPFFNNAQLGGANTYQFLELPHSALIGALGGKMVALQDNDPVLGYYNPSLLNKKMHQQLSINSVLYYAAINYGYAGYSKHYDSLGTFSGGIHYIHYGKFTRAAPNGRKQGSFSAGETALQLGWGRSYQRFTYGANLKLIGSFFERYNSFGIGLDIGGTYRNKEKQFIISGVLKNIGTQIKSYRSKHNEPFPFEIQLAASKGLLHVPLRLFVTTHNLQKWDIQYESPLQQQDQTPLVDSTNQQKQNRQYIDIADKLFRHFIFGAEFTIAERVSLRGGYNFMRRKELTIDSRKGMVGFSFGAAVKISHFKIGYARSLYHLTGGTNHFSIIMDMGETF